MIWLQAHPQVQLPTFSELGLIQDKSSYGIVLRIKRYKLMGDIQGEWELFHGIAIIYWQADQETKTF